MYSYCLKFQTKLTRSYWITDICFEATFYWDTVYITTEPSQHLLFDQVIQLTCCWRLRWVEYTTSSRIMLSVFGTVCKNIRTTAGTDCSLANVFKSEARALRHRNFCPKIKQQICYCDIRPTISSSSSFHLPFSLL